MSKAARNLLVGGTFLLAGLLLNLVLRLTTPHAVRADPDVFYVAPTAQGSGDCSSWAHACTLQTALSNAGSGDEIWVRSGVYYPTSSTSDRAAAFTLKDGVAVYGGFAGTETSRDQRDWQVNVTVLSGDIDHNDITDPRGVVTDAANIRGANSYHVISNTNVITTAVLDGFTITAGQANSDSDREGGGMYNYDSSPTVVNVAFSGNFAHYGGGMYNYYHSSPTLVNVTFSGNLADFIGGGMYSPDWLGDLTLINVAFSRNSASSCGGMFNWAHTATLTNVTFSDNSASNVGGGICNTGFVALANVTLSGNSAAYGGGIFNDSGSLMLMNVIFSGNLATYGGGMCNGGSTSMLTNVTFSRNSATYGGGIWNDGSNLTLTNVILWGDSAPTGPEVYNDDSILTSTLVIAYSDVQGCGGSGSGWNPACGSDGGHNIDADPLFIGGVNGNLRLRATSPAIDAGDNTAVPSGVVTDLDGNPRFVDIPTVADSGNGTPPIVDMGGYETQQYVDVTLSKTVSPPVLAPGEAITFVLTLSNTGTLPTNGIVVTDVLPAFLSGVSFASTLIVTDAGHVPPYVWWAQDLMPEQSGVITVSGVLIVPLAVGTYTNTAVIGATGDWITANNTALITLTVNVNDAPFFTSAPVLTATQDTPYTYTVAADDPDLVHGDALTITAPVLPSWLRLVDHGDGTATLAGTPADADGGQHFVRLRVTDSKGAFAEQAFTITVVANPRYYLPLVLKAVWVSMPDRGVPPCPAGRCLAYGLRARRY